VGNAKKAPAKRDIAPGAATRPPTLLETWQYSISEKEKTDNAIALSQALGGIASQLMLTVGLIVAAIAGAITVALVLVGKMPPGFAIGGGLLGTGAVTLGSRLIYRKRKAHRLGQAATPLEGVVNGTVNSSTPVMPDTNGQPSALPGGTQPIDDGPRSPSDATLADVQDNPV
jgi:hypothetical protein